jgi:hypothetical protein
MAYSILVKTDFGVPCFNLFFKYELDTKTFRDIAITNLLLDIQYTVDYTSYPIQDILCIRADNIMDAPIDDYASDICIKIPCINRLTCCQVIESHNLVWNFRTIENGSEYILTSYGDCRVDL